MKRLLALRYLVEVELYDIACAMLDGSYWQDDRSTKEQQSYPTQHDPAFWE